MARTSFATMDAICSLFSSAQVTGVLDAIKSPQRGFHCQGLFNSSLILYIFIQNPAFSNSFSLLCHRLARRSTEVMGEEAGEVLFNVKSPPFYCNIWSICTSWDSGISCGTKLISVLSRLTRRLERVCVCVM